MASTKVFPLRASPGERARWQLAADGAGLSFNAWARRALSEQAEFEAAVPVERAPEPVAVLSPRGSFDLGAKWKPDPRRK